jgi:tripartite-type tricarboxylate transporter receptor subunit TctC
MNAAWVGAIFMALALVVSASQTSVGQTSGTVRIIAPAPPGGGVDILARLLAEHMRQVQGPTIIVENRSGGGAVIGTEAVARAAPDGNTLLTASTTTLISPYLTKVNYHPLKSFEPICYLVNVPVAIVANSASPYRTLADLIDAARERPGELTMAGFGPGTPFHLGVEQLKRTANTNMIFVPYPGNAPAITALLGGHVTSAFVGYPNVAKQVQAGSLRALAMATRKRIDEFADIPTVGESGYSNYEVDNWFGIFAPALTPEQTVSDLISWFTAVMNLPEIKSKLIIQGLFPKVICGAEFGALLEKQYAEYGRLILESRMNAQ